MEEKGQGVGEAWRKDKYWGGKGRGCSRKGEVGLGRAVMAYFPGEAPCSTVFPRSTCRREKNGVRWGGRQVIAG